MNEGLFKDGDLDGFDGLREDELRVCAGFLDDPDDLAAADVAAVAEKFSINYEQLKDVDIALGEVFEAIDWAPSRYVRAQLMFLVHDVCCRMGAKKWKDRNGGRT